MTGDIHIPPREAVTTAHTAMTSARSPDTAAACNTYIGTTWVYVGSVRHTHDYIGDTLSSL